MSFDLKSLGQWHIVLRSQLSFSSRHHRMHYFNNDYWGILVSHLRYCFLSYCIRNLIDDSFIWITKDILFFVFTVLDRYKEFIFHSNHNPSILHRFIDAKYFPRFLIIINRNRCRHVASIMSMMSVTSWLPFSLIKVRRRTVLSKVARTCDVVQLLGNVIVTIVVTRLHFWRIFYASSTFFLRRAVRCLYGGKT